VLIAPGIGGLNTVLAAQAAEGPGGNTQSTARILVVTVDTSHSFNTFAVDPFHIHPPPLWMQVFGASNRQKKAADPLVRTRSSKKNRRENSLRRESRLFYFLNLWNFPELQAQATIH